jgi:hypothetical protein
VGAASTFRNPNWVRVNHRHPCPICGHPDWCSVSASGMIVYCMRVTGNQPTKNGGWIHQIGEPLPLNLQPPRPVKQLSRAAGEILHHSYTGLLFELGLSDWHRRNLRQRGLTDSQINGLNYRSLPLSSRDLIIRKLIAKNTPMEGVPGFFTNSLGQWRLAGPPGILVPCRDLQGWITGLQIRCDNIQFGKYRWLSSTEKPNGCSSGVRVHVAQPPETDRSEIWVTEGPLKADICSLKLKRLVLAIPGVACWNLATDILQELKPQRVIVALDMDKLSNPLVNRYKNLLLRALLKLRIKTFEADWNREFKGLDDLLAAGDK